MRNQMRNTLLAAAGALAVLTTASVMPAAALTIDPSAMRGAIDVVSPAEKVWCYGYGCGYRRYGYYGRPYYRSYGYRGYYWR
jgi:hypothetical protein